MQEDFKERDRMTFDEFCASVRMDIQKRLGRRYTVEEKVITKNNDTKRKALIIGGQESNICPTIYMEHFYEEYKGGTSLRDVEDSVLQLYLENRIEKKLDIMFLKEWRKVKWKVIFKLINQDRNRELLKEVPHRRFLDLAIVYEVFLGTSDEGDAVVLVNNGHLKQWGISEEELYAAASRNTPERMGCTFDSIGAVLLEILEYGEAGQGMFSGEQLDDLQIPMYILTNRHKFHGAGCLLYKDILKEIAEKWDCDICILPSSIHEVLLIPMDVIERLDGLSQMVRDINKKMVRPDEVLSDHVYQYVRKTGKIIMQEEKGYE